MSERQLFTRTGLRCRHRVQFADLRRHERRFHRSLLRQVCDVLGAKLQCVHRVRAAKALRHRCGVFAAVLDHRRVVVRLEQLVDVDLVERRAALNDVGRFVLRVDLVHAHEIRQSGAALVDARVVVAAVGRRDVRDLRAVLLDRHRVGEFAALLNRSVRAAARLGDGRLVESAAVRLDHCLVVAAVLRDLHVVAGRAGLRHGGVAAVDLAIGLVHALIDVDDVARRTRLGDLRLAVRTVLIDAVVIERRRGLRHGGRRIAAGLRDARLLGVGAVLRHRRAQLRIAADPVLLDVGLVERAGCGRDRGSRAIGRLLHLDVVIAGRLLVDVRGVAVAELNDARALAYRVAVRREGRRRCQCCQTHSDDDCLDFHF
ncbi:hypothetical protein AWB67_06742 [Caballeronia terrestris]|uniref:NAD-specific glutamate dehydrogenase n=1 Tax=Caballeronia terrestris TaxID=1226301 RepID=A0A158KVP4_9BURK|nr:hypothetical protein AWB67_06742 [Caballeronia terrestris]